MAAAMRGPTPGRVLTGAKSGFKISGRMALGGYLRTVKAAMADNEAGLSYYPARTAPEYPCNIV